MSLSSYRIPFLIPYFVEMQRKSYLNLLNTGLIYELSRKNPMYDSLKEFQIIFYPEYYQLNTPEYTAKTAILKFKTYSSKLYVPLQLTDYKSKQLKLHWIILGNLPLMTKRGNFIVNGSPRIIINQIVRSPGIYYKQIIDQKKRKTYYGDLISQRGAWLRLEIDKKKRVWIHMKKTRKIPALIFFKAVGISDLKIKESTKYSYFLETSKKLTEYIETENYQHPDTIHNSLLWIYAFVYPQKKKRGEITLKKAKKFLFRKFFSHRTYDLGYSGRNQLNKKFNSNIPANTCVLTPQDLLFALDYLIQFEQSVGLADDIDHLKNRRVRTSGELIQNQLGTGFIRLEKLIRDKTEDSTFSILNIFSTKPIDGALREFFGSSPLSQFMDQTNPLAELTHKRRISSLGPGGVSRETAGMEVRGIHPSHYGRICPIETPEGRNAGLVNSITTLAQVTNEGLIKTPFYSVYQGQVQKYECAALFSAAQEQHIIIAPSDLKTNYFNFLPYCSIPVRTGGDFKKLQRNEVQYMSVSPIQMISIATSLIPFLEHDDANRALMGSNMQRQAVPLILPERPAVGTGLETRVVSDSGHGLQAKTSGIIHYTSNKNILVTNFYTKPLKAKNFLEKKFFSNETAKTYLSFAEANSTKLDKVQSAQSDQLQNFRKKSLDSKCQNQRFEKIQKNQLSLAKKISDATTLNKTETLRLYKILNRKNLKPRHVPFTLRRAWKASIKPTSRVILLQNSEVQSTFKNRGTCRPVIKYNVFGSDGLDSHFIYLCDLINHNKNKKLIKFYKKSKWVGFIKSSVILNNASNCEQIKPKADPHTKYYKASTEHTLQSTLSGHYVPYSKTISKKYFECIDRPFKSTHKVSDRFVAKPSVWTFNLDNAVTLSLEAVRDQVQAAQLIVNSSIFCNKKFYSSKKPASRRLKVLSTSQDLNLQTINKKIIIYKTIRAKRSAFWAGKYIKNFIKKFQNECIELIFLQIFIEKKNLKHGFLFSSPDWQNFNNKKFAKSRCFKQTKLSTFFKIRDFKVSGFKNPISVSLLQKPISKKYYDKNILKNYSIFTNRTASCALGTPDPLGTREPERPTAQQFGFQNVKTTSLAFYSEVSMRTNIKNILSKKRYKIYETGNKNVVENYSQDIKCYQQQIFTVAISKQSGTSYVGLKNLSPRFGSRNIKPTNKNKNNFGLAQNYVVATSEVSIKYMTARWWNVLDSYKAPWNFKYIKLDSDIKTSQCAKRTGTEYQINNLNITTKIKISAYVSKNVRPQSAKRTGTENQINTEYFVDSNNKEVAEPSGTEYITELRKRPTLSFSGTFNVPFERPFGLPGCLQSTTIYYLKRLEPTVANLIVKDKHRISKKNFSSKNSNILKNLKSLKPLVPGFSRGATCFADKVNDLSKRKSEVVNYQVSKIDKPDQNLNASLDTQSSSCGDTLYLDASHLGFSSSLQSGQQARIKNEAQNTGKIVNKNIIKPVLCKNKIQNLRLKSQFTFFNTTINHVVLPYQHSNQNTCMHQTSLVGEGEWVQKGDLLADGAASIGGELALGKSILVAYMPWEGYNFEDAILVSESLIYNDVYTSIHIEKYKIEISDTQYGLEQITPNIPNITIKQKDTLNENGVIKLGSWVTEGDILVGKVTPILKRKISGHEKLLADILGTKKNAPTVRDTSLRLPKHVSGRIVHIELLENEISLDNVFQGPSRVHIYIAEKRKLQVGDKMSGRHGNKGIISNILPRQDMPYLADGTPIDMVLNPLGVPSRMNVGQIFECLLGLAAKELNEHFKLSCFDEMSGPEASRSFTYSKLFEARVKTQKFWLFNPNFPGKMQLFDGRSGECFHQKVTVGQPYMLKLVHLVDEKIHARSTGPYSLVTQQPLRGRSKHGGQRLGEMEVWALEGFGAAYTLQELLTAKSDDVKGRHQVMQAILEQKSILLGTPESFKVLLSELQSLCLNIGVYSINNSGTRKKIDIMQLSD